MFTKTLKILREVLPIILMMVLIPFIENDYLLTALYIFIIAVCLGIKKEKGDFTILAIGFCVVIISEFIFISTGVETFTRNSLFGLMPLWLPFLWAYAFVVMKRSLKLIGI